MAFKALLTQYRTEKGVTKTHLAQALSVSITVIADYEKGKIKPSLAKGDQLAKLLDLDPSQKAYFLKALLQERLGKEDQRFVQLADAYMIPLENDRRPSRQLPICHLPVQKGEQRNALHYLSDPSDMAHLGAYVVRYPGPNPVTEYGIQKGDMLVLSESEPVLSQDLVLVRIDESVRVRKVDFLADGSVLFQPCNAVEQSDLFNSAQDAARFEIIAKLLQVVKTF